MKLYSNRGFAPIIIIVVAILVIGGAATSFYSKNKTKKVERDAEKAIENEAINLIATTSRRTIQFDLNEQNNSGEKGKAVINEENGKAKVIINLTGKPRESPQPSHIHVGSCATLGNVKYPLVSIENGASQTMLPVSLDELTAQLPLAINVHKSSQEPDIYISCGGIPGTKKESAKASNVSVEKKTASPIVVEYRANGFSPIEVTINKGDAIKFVNKSGRPFSVASDPHPVHTYLPQFDQWKSSFNGEESYEFKFNQTGSWDYHNHIMSEHGGTVIVK